MVVDPLVVVSVLVGAVAAFAAVRAWVIARRSEERSLEANDVVWFGRQGAVGWEFTHLGSTAVQQVKIVLSVEQHTEVTEVDRVDPGVAVAAANALEHEFRTRSAREFLETEAENEERFRDLEIPNGFGGSFRMPAIGAVELPYFGISNVAVRAAITWRSPSGTPRSQSWSATVGYSGDEEYE